MFTRFLSGTAIAALALGISACSGGEPAQTAAATAPAAPAAVTETATAPEAAATPVAMAAAPTASDMSHMDHSAMTMGPAAPAAAPAPAPEVAPDNSKPAGITPVGAVTNFSLPIAKIKDFTLKDQTGKSYELYKMADAKAIVLTMHTKGCPIGQQLQPDFKALQAKYEAKGVKFLMLNSNTYDTPAAIAEEVKSFGSTIPVLKDTDQSVAEPLGVERATETLVIQPGTWKILYQGPINDRVTYGRARAVASQQYVGDVVDAMLAGKTVTPSYIAPEGCILEFEHRKG